MTPSKPLIALIALYQLSLGALTGPRCRFHPTCSEYAKEALRRHGALRGAALGLARLARCHPWHAGGVDPVPAAPGEADA